MPPEEPPAASGDPQPEQPPACLPALRQLLARRPLWGWGPLVEALGTNAGAAADLAVALHQLTYRFKTGKLRMTPRHVYFRLST